MPGWVAEVAADAADRGGNQAQSADREVALGEDGQQFAADRTGGVDNGDGGR
jgi:hypothetical protein